MDVPLPVPGKRARKKNTFLGRRDAATRLRDNYEIFCFFFFKTTKNDVITSYIYIYIRTLTTSLWIRWRASPPPKTIIISASSFSGDDFPAGPSVLRCMGVGGVCAAGCSRRHRPIRTGKRLQRKRRGAVFGSARAADTSSSPSSCPVAVRASRGEALESRDDEGEGRCNARIREPRAPLAVHGPRFTAGGINSRTKGGGRGTVGMRRRYTFPFFSPVRHPPPTTTRRATPAGRRVHHRTISCTSAHPPDDAGEGGKVVAVVEGVRSRAG